MEIWLDTTNLQTVQHAVRLGLLSGVTTNPALVAQSKKSLDEILEDLLHYQEGPVTAQVVSENVSEMVQQGQTLFSFSNRIIVKVPATKAGLEAIHLLSRQGIPTMATALFTTQQALMAALAGADYIAPYLGRIEQAGQNPWEMLQTTLRIFQQYRIKTKILGASIKTVDQALKCAEIGIFAMTVKEDLFEQLIEGNPLTTQCVQAFTKDWQKVSTSLLTK